MKKSVLKFFRRIWRSMFPQYILRVEHRGQDRKVHIKTLHKKTPTKITGVNMQNEQFEIVSATPLNYYIVEYKDDLK